MSTRLSYERLIVQKNEGARRWRIPALIFLYFNWVLLWSLLMLRIGINAPMLFFIPLTTLLLIFSTRKYTRVEFEYTCADGALFIDKIYGKKKRKSLLEAELKQAILIVPNTAEQRKRIEENAPFKILDATASSESRDIWLLLFEETSENRLVVLIEADEPLLRILRYYNPRATARS